MSSGSPSRPTSGWPPPGMTPPLPEFGERGPPMRPGATQFTVMPLLPNSTASALVRPTRPAFAAETWARPDAPVWAVRPPILTMVPRPFASMPGMTARLIRKAPSSTTPITRRQLARLMAVKSSSRRSAALLTRISTGPSVAAVSFTMRATPASSETSPMTTRAAAPRAAISRTVSSASSREDFAFTAIAAPSRASASAMARPIRRTPPVTSATWPLSSPCDVDVTCGPRAADLRNCANLRVIARESGRSSNHRLRL